MSCRAIIVPSTSVRRNARHAALLVTVSAVALFTASPDVYAKPLGSWTPAPSAAAIAAAQSGSQEAARAARDARNSLKRATLAIQAMQASQQAARDAARAALQAMPNVVPNGLRPGGLQIGTGVVNAGGVNQDLWQGANLPTQFTDGDRTKIEIQQTQQKAILTWDTFHVGGKTDVNFKQDASNWVALNRVLGTDGKPSQILGSINAKGQVYIINQNGIIFGGTSQINVGALIATTAKISNDQFLNKGIYSSGSGSNWVPSFTDAAELLGLKPDNADAGKVRVEAGAQIATHAPADVTRGGGFVLLMGGEVHNAGAITTPNGQTQLAAGDDFVLRRGYGTKENSFSTTHGNEIAVGSWNGANLFNTTIGGGLVRNDGTIFSAQGDITLAGRTIEQNGVLVASTSVNTRGTIHLLNSATDTLGSITLGANSLTTIIPELESKETALNSQRDGLIAASEEANRLRAAAPSGAFSNLSLLADRLDQSRIEIVTGGNAIFKGGATPEAGSLTIAQGGQVQVSAGGRIFTESGSVIDVSGVRDVSLAMSANNILVNIQGNELRDSPQNRDHNWLKNGDVWVDIRDLIYVPSGTGGYDGDRYYTPGGLLEVGGYLANTAHKIGEWSAVGGTITLSAPEVIAQDGSVFDLSGGSVRYEAGYIVTSNFLGKDGRITNINDARGDITYYGLGHGFVRTSERWGVTEVWTNPLGRGRVSTRWEDGYTVGRDAGQLILSTPTAIFEGEIVADVVQGERQINARPDGVSDGYKLSQNNVAQAGRLLAGSYNAVGRTGVHDTDVRIADIANVAAGLDASSAIPAGRMGTLWFDADHLSAQKLGGFDLATSGSIAVDSNLTLADGGSLSLIAPIIDVNADITARGGSVVLTNMLPVSVSGGSVLPLSPVGGRATITVGHDATIDTRGLWSNFLTDPGADLSRTAYVDGGNVTIRSTGDVVFETGALIDASSGGAILATGKTKGGAGGDVKLSASYDATQGGLGAAAGNHGELTFDGKVVSNGVTRGGALTLETGGAIVIGGVGYGHGDTLAAGTAAPYDMVLTQSLTVPAGTLLPMPGVGETRYAKAGQTITSPTSKLGGAFFAGPGRVYAQTAVAWENIPARMDYVTNADGTGTRVTVQDGGTIPAGVYIVSYRTADMPSNFTIPENIFPNGLYLNGGSVPAKYAAGMTAEFSITYDIGTFVPKGTLLGQDISVQPLRSSSLDASLFNSGFSSYTINGAGGLTVAAGTHIAPTMPVYRFTPASFAAPTGADPSVALELWTPPLYLENATTATLTQRAGVDITLMAASITGRVTIAPDASVTVDHGRSITLSSGGSIEVQGRLTAHGGSIALLESFPDEPTEAYGETAVSRNGGQGRTHWVGETGVLDVSAVARTATDTWGRSYGIVRDGGSIKFGRAARSAEDYDTIGLASAADAFIVIEKGARLDASGTSAIIDLAAGTGSRGGSQPVAVSSDGGSITLKSYNGIQVEGTLNARSGGVGASGGTLHVMLETPNYATDSGGAFLLSVPDAWLVGRVLTIGQSAVPGVLPPGSDPLSANLTPGRGGIAADTIAAGGFDNLFLGARNAIVFDGDVSLSAGRSITLRTGAIYGAGAAGKVSVDAPYVFFAGNGALATSTSTRLPTALPTSVTALTGGRFSAKAGLIDIGGTQANNFTDISLVSRGDLRFVASTVARNNTGSTPVTEFAAPNGDLELIARQVYPATGVAAAVLVGSVRNGTIYAPVRPNAKLTIRSVDGVTPDLPYSAFGSLALIAPLIEQGGVVRAPLGSITMGASPSFDATLPDTLLTLLPGSITSVSGKGLIMPFGGTADGVSYVLDGATAISANLLTGEFSIGAINYVQGVTLEGVDVRVDKGAVVDVSGGGDLLGAAFVSGRGGSVDVLTTPLINANPANSFSKAGSQVYAIVPGVVTAPVTGGYYSAWNGSTPAIGQQITIPGGVPGLPAGTYTLLPANYALLPGAFRVELGATGTAVARMSGVHGLDGGSYVAAGYQGVAGTAIRDALPTQVILTPAGKVRNLSRYNETGYSDFQLAQSQLFDTVRTLLPRDGKFLAINLGQTIEDANLRDALVFNGVANFAADSTYKNAYGGSLVLATTDRGGSRNALQITGDDSATRRSDTATTVRASAINAMGAASLYLGGRPTLLSTAPASIFVRNRSGSGTVQDVTLESGAVLRGAQVFLFGKTITLEDGATIDTLGQGVRAPDSRTGYAFTNYAPSSSTASSLLVASNGHVVLDASNTANSGDIRIGNGARLLTEGTLGFLTQSGATFDGTPIIAAGEVSFALSSINIGSAEALAAAAQAGRLPAGLGLDQSFLDMLLTGSAAPGASPIRSLALSAAESINFYGDTAIDFTAAGGGVGQLVLSAPAIYGAGGANDTASIKVDTLVWNGNLLDKGKSTNSFPIWESGKPGAVTPGGAGTGSGAFIVDARTIVFGYAIDSNPNTTTTLDRLMLGFSTVDFRASEKIVANTKGTLNVFRSADPAHDKATYDAASYAGSGGVLNFITPLLTGDPSAILKVRAGGAITVAAPEGAMPSTAKPSALGVDISLASGGALTLDTAVFLPTGRLSLIAAGDLILGDRARIDLSGQAVSFFDVTKHTWGGDLLLESTHGNIEQKAGSVIDVSAQNSDAGSVRLTAIGSSAGRVSLGGTLRGHGGVGFAGGSFDIRAQRIGANPGALTADFAALNTRLTGAGFTESRRFMLKQGDLVIGNELKAHEISVSVDGGTLRVDGRVDASGQRVGNITLAARDDLIISGTLDAHGTTVNGDSNGAAIAANNSAKIDLTSKNGTLRLGAGAVLDLSTPDGVSYGELTLNAARTGKTSGDIAVEARGPLTIRGARSIMLNAFWRYDLPDGGVIDQTLLDGYDRASQTFMHNAYSGGALNAGLQARLSGILANPIYESAFHLRPGVEIASTGDLSTKGDIDLAGYRYGPNADRDPASAAYGAGEAMALVVRAGGNVTIKGSISDGFKAKAPSEIPIDIVAKFQRTTVASKEYYRNTDSSAAYFDVILGADWVVPPFDVFGSNVRLPRSVDNVIYQPGTTIPKGTVLNRLLVPVSLLGTADAPSIVETVPGAPGVSPGAEALGSGRQSASISIVAGADLSSANTRAVQELSRQTYSRGGTVFEGSTDVRNSDNFFFMRDIDWGWGSLRNLYSGGDIFLYLAKDWTVPNNGFYEYMNGPFGNVDAEGKTYAPGSVVPKGTLIQFWTFDASEPLPDLAESMVTKAGGYSGSLILDNAKSRDVAGMPVPLASVLRTGAGNLDLRAAGSFTQKSLYNISTNGGGNAPADLTVAVQGDMTGFIYNHRNGSVVKESASVTNWLNGNQGTDVFYDGFTGLGALGGGNVTVEVGGDAGQLLVPALTNITSTDYFIESTGLAVAATSGDVTLKIGGRLNPYVGVLNRDDLYNVNLNGVFTALRGDLTLKAGAIGGLPINYGVNSFGDPRGVNYASAATVGERSNSYSIYGAVTAVVGDGATSLRARGDLALGQVGAEASKAYWTPRTSLSLFSAGGNVTPITAFAYESNSGNAYRATDPNGNIVGAMLPSRFSAVAASGSIYTRGAQDVSRPGEISYTLMASSSGSLELLAMDSIYGSGSGTTPRWVMLSNDTLTLHEGDTNPIRVYAVNGDLVNVTLGDSYVYTRAGVTYTANLGAKAARVLAGGDIVNFGRSGSYHSATTVPSLILNTNADDVSVIRAGRNIYYANVDIAGPGALEVTAGGTIYQGDIGSITSIGALAIGDTRSGASIILAAGMSPQGPDYAALYKYLDPANLLPAGSILEGSGKVAKTYESELKEWLRERFHYTASSVADALAYFQGLPMEQQQIFLHQVYFAELREGGREYNDPDSMRYQSYLRGREAIAALFPEKTVGGNAIERAGDIVIFGGAGVRTELGGDIQMFAPGGQIVVGVEGNVPPASAGVLTLGPGDIQMYSKGSILLGLSRIMTSFGGDILAWSAEGDINAGRGAKTTIGYVPPRRVYDNYGMVTLSPNAPTSGAGISARSVIPGIQSGDVDLIAPLGTIDIGEAGVSGLNINVAALHIVNSANISAQGNVTGVPTIQAPNIGGLTEASNTAGAAAQQASVPQQGSGNAQPSIIIVEVLGFGGGAGEAPESDEDRRRRTRSRQSYDPTGSVQYVGVGQLTDAQLKKLTPAEQQKLAVQ